MRATSSIARSLTPFAHQTPKVPTADFDHSLHEQGESRIIPLDLSYSIRTEQAYLD